MSRPAAAVMAAAVVLAAAAGAASLSPPAIAAPQSARTPAIRLVITADEAVGSGLTVREFRGSEPRTTAFTTRRGVAPNTLVVSFACSPGVYVIETQAFVSTPIVVDGTDACVEPREVALVPAARLQGRVAARERSDAMTGGLRLALQPCGSRANPGTSSVYWAAVNRDRSFTAVVPAGCSEIVAARPGFAPIVLPGATYAFRQVHDLGELGFRAGGTITTDVVQAEHQPAAGVQVWVVRAGGLASFLRDVTKGTSATPVGEARADKNGRAAVAGVPQGVFYIVGKDAGRVGVAGPVDVTPETIVATESLSLLGPGTVTCTVATPDAGWLVEGTGLAVMAAPVVDGLSLATAGLRVPVAREEPTSVRVPFGGRWRFQLLTSMGGGASELVDEQETDVRENQEAALVFHAVRTAFDGRALVGSRPVAGALTLTSIETSRRHSTTADKEGRFRVWLPTAGRYTAELRVLQQGLWLRGAVTDFEVGRAATVRFPGLRVDGNVVLPDGSPVAGAVVNAVAAPDADAPAAPGLARATSDSAGAFSLDTLSVGSWQLTATSGTRASEAWILALEDNIASAPIRLVLEDKTRLTGRVIDEAGRPVPTARGRWVAEPAAPGEMPEATGFQADAEGNFTITLTRGGSANAQVLVIAPGYPITVLRLSSVGGKPVTLTVPSGGGYCRLVFARPGDPSTGALPADIGNYALFNELGAVLPVREAMEVGAATVASMGDRSAVEFLSLPAGAWRVARFANPLAGLGYLAGAGGMPVVHEFILTAGGRAVVDLR
jgi:hypothetical protein